ncbi:MAG: hypothetical protein ABIZ91_09795 [Gemmatimonadaceae bacterium]
MQTFTDVPMQGNSPTVPTHHAQDPRPSRSRPLQGDWFQLKDELRLQWPQLSERDITAVAGQREELMRRLKKLYQKTYGEIEREVTEFELRRVRDAYAARPARGIGIDG